MMNVLKIILSRYINFIAILEHVSIEFLKTN